MRAVFGVVSLLVVLGIVGFTASRQLRSTGLAAGPSASAAPGTQPRQIQQKVADEMTKAIEQGAAARRSEADQ